MSGVRCSRRRSARTRVATQSVVQRVAVVDATVDDDFAALVVDSEVLDHQVGTRRHAPNVAEYAGNRVCRGDLGPQADVAPRQGELQLAMEQRAPGTTWLLSRPHTHHISRR